MDRVKFAARNHRLEKQKRKVEEELSAALKTKHGLQGTLRYKEDQVAQRNKFVNQLQEQVHTLKEKLDHKKGKI